MYIFNKTNDSLIIDILGVELDPNETRNMFEICNKIVMRENANTLIDLIYADKILFKDPNMDLMSKSGSVIFVVNGYTDVIIVGNKVASNEKYYYLRDNFGMKRNNNRVVTKTFIGNVSTLNIFAKEKVTLKITTGEGLVMPIEYIEKKEQISFDFDGDMSNISLEFTLEHNKTEIEIFIDGKTTEPTEALQTFINDWRE